LSFADDLRLAFPGATAGLDSEAGSKLEALESLLDRWSSKLDLIGFKTARDRVRRYFAEPLSAAGWLPETGSALDIGSGGGSPGLPFAIVRPRLSWTFLEPRLRRRLFLEEAIRELGLDNVRVEAGRFGESAPGEGRMAISTRGVRLGRAQVEEVRDALSPGGRFLWLSGEDRLREAAGWLAAPGYSLEGPVRLLPGSEARLLVVSRAP
jgi:16S rRNA (guanine527-N7)-methyltransferase